MIYEGPSTCMASRTEHFWVWALGPKPEASPRVACFTGTPKCNPPAFVCILSSCYGGGVPYSHGGHTRYRMAAVPMLLDDFLSKNWRTACILDHSLNGVTVTSLTLVSCPFITEWWTCRPVFVTTGLLRGSRSPLLFRSGTRPVPCVCAKLVVPCRRLPCFPVVIHLHREDVDSRTPSPLLPWITSGRIAITRYGLVDRRPALRTLSSPARIRLHPYT